MTTTTQELRTVSCRRCCGCKTLIGGGPCPECGATGKIPVPPLLAATTMRCDYCRRPDHTRDRENRCILCRGTGVLDVPPLSLAMDDDELLLAARRVWRVRSDNGHEETEARIQRALWSFVGLMMDAVLEDPEWWIDQCEERWEEALQRAAIAEGGAAAA